MGIEIIPVVVKPETVEKLQADVAVLAQDSIGKQKAIDKLQFDLALQNEKIENLEATINP